MHGVILGVIFISTLGLIVNGLFIPTKSQVHLVSTFPQYSSQLTAVESVFSTVHVSRTLIQRGQKKIRDAVNTLKSVSTHDLVVLVNDQSDNSYDGTDFSTAFVQVIFGSGDMVQVFYKSKLDSVKSTPKIRFETSALSSALKTAFYDIFVDEFLHGGDVDASSIQVSNL